MASVFGIAIVGLLLPILLAVLWLHGHGALGAFVTVARTLIPAHAALGRKPLSFLLVHSLSPIPVLVVLWAALLVFSRKFVDAEGVFLGLGLLGSLVAYVVQGKGYPYQRYPFLALLLLVIGLRVDRSLDAPKTVPRVLSVGVALLACCVFAPRFARRAATFSARTPVETALAAALLRIGDRNQLDGRVQCMDTFEGCTNMLNDLRLQQSTGFLYDCYLFSGEGAVQTAYRERFWRAYREARPWVLVLASRACFSDEPNGYGRFASWPAFAESLRTDYHPVAVWKGSELIFWSSRKLDPSEFTVMVRDSP